MFGRGKIVGPILILVGVVICLLASVFLGVGLATENLGVAGAVLGISLFGFIPLLIFGGVGVYLYINGKKEEADQEVVRQKQRILGLIQAQGKASVDSIMLEMELSREQVTTMIYEMVSMDLFTGYVDWDKRTFYSRDAAAVGSNTCPNCGGIRELVGKGVVKCPYCGVSLFIPPTAENTRAEPKAPEESPPSGESQAE
jgi:hypothetical protein